MHQTFGRHNAQNINVTFNQRAFGGDQHRVIVLTKHRQKITHHAITRLNRLVRIGVGANRNRGHIIGFGRQLTGQNLGGVFFTGQTRLEIKPSRQTQIRMTGARIAITAPVFAPAIRVDRAIKRNVRAVITHDDFTWAFINSGRAQGRFLKRGVPAVDIGLAGQSFEPSNRVGRRAAGFGFEAKRQGRPKGECGIIYHALDVEQNENICQALPYRLGPIKTAHALHGASTKGTAYV